MSTTISDSFLERAMDSHMSEVDYNEAEVNIKKSAEKVFYLELSAHDVVGTVNL